jgi:hypothetical protein
MAGEWNPNVFVGYQAGYSSVTGNENVFFGYPRIEPSAVKMIEDMLEELGFDKETKDGLG